jgi:hypothetical protein
MTSVFSCSQQKTPLIRTTLDESMVLMVVELEGKLSVKAKQNKTNGLDHDASFLKLLLLHRTNSENFHLTRIHHKMAFVQTYAFDYLKMKMNSMLLRSRTLTRNRASLMTLRLENGTNFH